MAEKWAQDALRNLCWIPLHGPCNPVNFETTFLARQKWLALIDRSGGHTLPTRVVALTLDARESYRRVFVSKSTVHVS
jgi:hypothetical protein